MKLAAHAGYVYVLMNPSMEGLVKIGKTSRDPESRVSELSGATGVATPFVLVYKAFFVDCTTAEQLIHTALERKGHRVSQNREFFGLPVHEAVSAVMNVERSLGTTVTDGTAELGNVDASEVADLNESLFFQAYELYDHPSHTF